MLYEQGEDEMMSRKKLWRRRKRRLIAYTLRTLVFLIAAGMVSLMGCGCMFLAEHLSGVPEKDEAVTVQGFNITNGDGNEPVEMNQLDKNFTVVLDAGHGGNDAGTLEGDIYEKDINLSLTQMIKKELEDAGVTVVMTRESDVYMELEDRAALANRADADLFVSIHCNYYEKDSSINGLECYYLNGSDSAGTYAASVIRAVEEESRVVSRGVKTGNFVVLRKTSIPAILIETGYLSNSPERRKLADTAYQQILAETIADGIISSIS